MMILITHIAISLINVLLSTFNIFYPSQFKIKLTYWLTGATLASGLLLGFERDVNWGQACLSGIAYVGLVSVNILLAKKRLSSVNS